MSETKRQSVEGFNSRIDYFKHMTTLSTGSIVLIATFLEKLFANPLWKSTIIISLMGFMISVISSVIAHTLGIMFEHPENKSQSPEWVSLIGGLSLLMIWLGFLTGILSLAIFALRNLLG